MAAGIFSRDRSATRSTVCQRSTSIARGPGVVGPHMAQMATDLLEHSSSDQRSIKDSRARARTLRGISRASRGDFHRQGQPNYVASARRRIAGNLMRSVYRVHRGLRQDWTGCGRCAVQRPSQHLSDDARTWRRPIWATPGRRGSDVTVRNHKPMALRPGSRRWNPRVTLSSGTP